MSGISDAGIPTPVSTTSIRAPPSGSARAVTRTSPPRPVNLIALPTRFVTTWPMRGESCRIRIGRSGNATVRPIPFRSAEATLLLDRGFDGAAQVVRAQLEEHEARVELRELQEVLGEPVEALDLGCRRVEELGPGRGIQPGGALEQLVERAHGSDRRSQLMADVGQEVAAAVAVAADDLDALLEPVGHRVERWTAPGAPGSPTDSSSVATRADRSPSATRRDASVRRGAGS